MDTKKFNIQINPLDSLIEKMVCKQIDKNPPESYSKMDPDSLDKVYNLIMNSFPKEKTENFSPKIILSIRANLMRYHMTRTHKSIQAKKNEISHDYNNGVGIKKLVTKYDGSPLNLLRLIFQTKYNAKLTKIINNPDILEPIDKSQLQWAIDNDAYALINQNKILTKSNEFEDKIKEILDKLNIQYKTQVELADEQIKENNIATNTPDFQIQSDFYINGIKINWIDAKNFYGSNSNFIVKKLKSQTKKYIDKWGYGSIIFNLGFNSELEFANILLIDFKSFKKLLD